MASFYELWESEVKAQALACVNTEVARIVTIQQEGNLTEEEKIKFKEFNKQYTDVLAQYYISKMCWYIEHDLAYGRDLKANMKIIAIYNCLTSESYWTNVFKNNTESEEAKNLLTFTTGLKRLLNIN